MDNSPSTIAADADSLAEARRRDPVGHEIHAALGALYVFSLPVATAVSSVTFALLLVFSVIRLRHTLPAFRSLTRSGVLWLVLAWVAWHAVSMAWSVDAAQGWDELRAARVLATPWMLWPVLDRAVVFIIAGMAGVVTTNAVQLLQWLELFGLSPAENNRLRGLLHPTQTGAWCVAAMCWSVSGTILGRGKVRIFSLLVLLSAAAGLVGTGSRGPWLAGAAALPLMLIVMVVRRADTRRLALGLIVAGLVGAIAAGWIARSFIERRIDTAVTELRDGWNDDVYWTDGGLRIGLWRWAWDGFADAPIIGQGAGSFESLLAGNPSYATTRGQQEVLAPRFDMSRGHAHSVYMQTLCDLGLIGALIGIVGIVLLLRNAWRDRQDHPFADGNFFAIIAWLVGAAFECYNLNGHTFGLFALLVAITLPHRPAESKMPRSLREPP